MTAASTWGEAQELHARLSEDHLFHISHLTELPLASLGLLKRIGRLENDPAEIVADLRQLGLVDAAEVALARGRHRRLFYLTDAGLAVAALDWETEPSYLARRYGYGNLPGLAARLPQLAALYDLLGWVVNLHPGPLWICEWHAPWRCRVQPPTAKSPVSLHLPAYALIRWQDEIVLPCLLFPDRGEVPLRAYLPALRLLYRSGFGWGQARPYLIVFADSVVRRAALLDMLNELVEEFPGPTAGFALIDKQELDQHAPTVRLGGLVSGHPWMPSVWDRMLEPDLAPKKTTTAVPHWVSDFHKDPILTLTPADRALLALVARHLFITPAAAAEILGLNVQATRRRISHLIDLGLMGWPMEIDRTLNGDHLELTRKGLQLVAAQEGQTLCNSVRYCSLAGGGQADPIGERADLLKHLQHTTGLEEVHARFAQGARQSRIVKGWDFELCEWRNTTASRNGRVRPDAYGVMRHDSLLSGFFIEFDRGTERARDYGQKFGAYVQWWREEGYGDRYRGLPPMLIISTSEQACARMSYAMWKAGATSLPILLTLKQQIDEDPLGPLGKVWVAPGMDQKQHWLSVK